MNVAKIRSGRPSAHSFFAHATITPPEMIASNKGPRGLSVWKFQKSQAYTLVFLRVSRLVDRRIDASRRQKNQYNAQFFTAEDAEARLKSERASAPVRSAVRIYSAGLG